jgi:hypothetical protein
MPPFPRPPPFWKRPLNKKKRKDNSSNMKKIIADDDGPRDLESVANSSVYDLSEEDGAVKSKEKALAKKETKTVRRLKVALLVLLAVFAVGVAVAVNFYVRNSEMAEFESNFKGRAVKVLATLGVNLDSTMQSADTFVTNIMSHARDTNQKWPFVTIPDFAVRGGKVLAESKAYVLNLYTWIEPDQRQGWQNYTSTHNQWVEDSIEIQAKSDHYTGPITRNGPPMCDAIFNYEDGSEEEQCVIGSYSEGPYLPWWQCYPVINYGGVYNW